MVASTGGFGIESLLRGVVGIITVLAVSYLMSSNRKKIDWKLVGSGLLIQFALALSVLYVPFVGTLFELLGKAFIKLMDFTQAGVGFLLGPYATKSNGFIFLIHSMPVIIFFTAIVSLFYHWGIIQPVLIKNYLPSMNRSEIFLVMVAGMGTIAGSVMATYIGMLSGGDPATRLLFAKHLLSASVMAAPGSIVIAKMLCPQTELVTEQEVKVSLENQHHNVLEALASGTSVGIKLVVNIAAMLLVFISMVALLNYVSEGLIGKYTGLNDWVVSVTDGKQQGFTFQFILGMILSPFMWLIGVPFDDMMLVGSLLGQKTILNEFVAYFQLQQWKDAGLFVYDKSIIMSTYILCGFANISSIGILLGGLGVLTPNKQNLISKLGIPTMIGGALVSIMSATMVGMILG